MEPERSGMAGDQQLKQSNKKIGCPKLGKQWGKLDFVQMLVNPLLRML
jgi:hypothetical protein